MATLATHKECETPDLEHYFKSPAEIIQGVLCNSTMKLIKCNVSIYVLGCSAMQKANTFYKTKQRGCEVNVY
jgi:hypothetical protein